MSHVPTTDSIIDQINIRIESNDIDQTEREALARALMILEDYMAERSGITALTDLAEVTIAVRTLQKDRSA